MKAVTLGAINGMLESLVLMELPECGPVQAIFKAKESTPGECRADPFQAPSGYVGVVDALPGSPAAKAAFRRRRDLKRQQRFHA